MTGATAHRGGSGRRPAVLTVLACLAVLLGGGPATPALAAPVTSAPPDDDTSDPARPVGIDVTRFEPRTVTPGSTVTVSGTLANTGTQTITDLGVRLQRGQVMTTRAELVAADANVDPDSSIVPGFQPIAGALAPGASLPFTYAIPADALQLERNGVYPALLNVNGTVDGGERRRVGELRSYLVQQPAIPAGRTTVAWLWPLVERTHRTASGGFADDDLAKAVRSGGRLDRALSVVEDLPTTTPADGGDPVPAAPVTLAIDPALVEELEIMAAGPYAVDGQAGAGRGTAAADAYLDRLRAVAADHLVVALSYGDADAEALETAGLGDVMTRSLPAGGTAADPPAGDARPSAAPTSGTSAPPADGDTNAATGAGARVLAAALGVKPRTDLAWVADGGVQPGTLAALKAGGARRVVLGAGAFTDGGRALGLVDGRAAARTTVALPTGSIDALIADPGLGAVAGSAVQAAGGPRMAEQRYLAELSLLSLQAPADPALASTVLVAPPRDVTADADGVRAMMADTAELPWLQPASVADLARVPTTAAGQLLPPAPALLDPAGLADLAAAVAVRDDLAGAVVTDPDAALAPYDAAVARAASVAWRADPAGFRAAARGTRTTLAGLRDRVTLLAPADGTYSLASSNAPLVLTVRNDLPFAVRVLLEVRTRGNVGLSVEDIGAQELAPGERTTLQVPTEVRQSGRFAVTAALTTPSGGALGDRVVIQVRSTAYGPISLFITIGAAALLGLLFLRRLIRFVVRRRRGGPPADDLPDMQGPEGAAVPLPPTRSPV